MVASTFGGLLTFYGGTTLLGLDSGFLEAGRTWGWKEVLVLGASLVIALFGGLLGFAVGAGVKVRSEWWNHVLSVLWQYLANGCLIWIALLSLTLTKAVGQAEAKALLERLGTWHATLSSFGLGAAGSLVMAGILLGAGQLNPGAKPNFLVCLLLAWPVAAVSSFLQFRLLGIATDLSWLHSAVFPVILVPMSAFMVARDARQRRDLLARWSR